MDVVPECKSSTIVPERHTSTIVPECHIVVVVPECDTIPTNDIRRRTVTQMNAFRIRMQCYMIVVFT